MLYSENCNKYYNIKYFENYIKIRIVNIPNNKYDIGNLYCEILEIFKLNKVDMIIEYLVKVYLINYENDIKKIFQKFINTPIFYNSLVNKSYSFN